MLAIRTRRAGCNGHGQVTFRIKDYRRGGQKTTITIPGVEFVLRFSHHILPSRFKRVRYAGWLGSNGRDHNLATARTALRVIEAQDNKEEATPPQPDESQTKGQKKEVDIEALLENLAAMRFRCPACGEQAIRWAGEMIAATGWHPFQGRLPPIDDIRQMFAQAAAHHDKDKIRPPPVLSQST